MSTSCEDVGKELIDMKILDLHAGSQSFSKAAREMGHETFTTDIKQWGGIDYVVDILEFGLAKLPWPPDFIWASPPCTTFSVASIGHHWTGGKKAYIPKTDAARVGLQILYKTVEIIQAFSGCEYAIENPRGLMRKMPIMEFAPIRHTVTYCQYGDTRMKPTDIWTNNKNWTPRPMCKNGDTCHERAPRGARTGTQGLKGRYKRSIVPEQLCREILEASV